MMRMRIDEIQMNAVRNSNKRIKVRGSAETWGDNENALNDEGLKE